MIHLLWSLQQLNLIFYPMIYGVVYMQGGVGFQFNASTPKAASQGVVPVVFI